jgi:hypothetical protein
MSSSAAPRQGVCLGRPSANPNRRRIDPPKKQGQSAVPPLPWGGRHLDYATWRIVADRQNMTKPVDPLGGFSMLPLRAGGMQLDQLCG